MKMSELIADLQESIKLHGDLPIAFDQYGVNGFYSPVEGVGSTLIEDANTGEIYITIDILDESYEYTEVEDDDPDEDENNENDDLDDEIED